MSGIDEDDDEAFVRYCQIHSETELALFSGKHINRLFRMAGRKAPCEPGQFLSMDRWTVEDLKKEIEEMKPPCLSPGTKPIGLLGSNLQAHCQKKIRELYGWNYEPIAT